jgi:hypothetical protein
LCFGRKSGNFGEELAQGENWAEGWNKEEDMCVEDEPEAG